LKGKVSRIEDRRVAQKLATGATFTRLNGYAGDGIPGFGGPTIEFWDVPSPEMPERSSPETVRD
jgi:hypothetical protein